MEEPILLNSARGSRDFFQVEEGLIIYFTYFYFVEEPTLLNSARGSHDFFLGEQRHLFGLCAEEPTLLHTAGGSGFCYLKWNKGIFFYS